MTIHRRPDASSSLLDLVGSRFQTLRSQIGLFFVRLAGYSLENRPMFLDQFYEWEKTGDEKWRYAGHERDEGEVFFVEERVSVLLFLFLIVP